VAANYSTGASLKTKFWAVGLSCFLLFCVAPASALAGSIVGKVTTVGGAPIPHARACVHDVSGSEQVRCAQANDEGEYAITAIAPDEYKLYFEEPQGGPEYVVNYWPDKETFEEGVPFQIASGGTMEVNATLAAAGRIEGTLTAEGDVPSSGRVCASKSDGTRSVCVDAAGESEFRIRHLAPGSYFVEFTDPGFLPEYGGGVRDFAEATPVMVQAGAVTTASADLEAEPGITGTVTSLDTGEPIEGVEVCVEEEETSGGCVYTDEEGRYTYHLFPGTYRVRFGLDGYATQYYDDADIDHAMTVTINGSLVRGVDAVLEDAGSLKGHVATNDGQTDLGDVTICALGVNSEECVGARQQSGAYEFLRLAPGAYKVRFSLHGHFTQFFRDKATEAEAESVTVTAGHESGGVDATLIAEEAPTSVTPPLVTGVGKVGQTLSCSNGVWSGNPASFTYEYFWLRGEEGEEEEISGAESNAYHLDYADAGESISCGVVATNSVGTEYEFSSNWIKVAPLGSFALITAGDGTGRVSSSPSGINCAISCAAFFEEGTTVTLTAAADSDSEFTGWSGACSGTGPCVVVIGAATEVVADFAKQRGGGARNDRPTTPSPATPSPPAPTPATKPAPNHHKKKALRCKKGFRKVTGKGKARCVKATPKTKKGKR
jgi:hypothetical protein